MRYLTAVSDDAHWRLIVSAGEMQSLLHSIGVGSSCSRVQEINPFFLPAAMHLAVALTTPLVHASPARDLTLLCPAGIFVTAA